mgnify:FL=1
MSRIFSCVCALLTLSWAYAAEPDMQGWIDEQVGSGAALAVSIAHRKDGEVTYYGGGVVAPGSDQVPDENSQYEIGSITKSFTHLLLAELVEMDRVGYDTTIGDLLGADFELRNAAVGDITLLQLATHRSGLPRMPGDFAPTNPLDPYQGYDSEALLRSLATTRDKQPLGTYYSYSNFGVGILGYLLGQVHGGGYAEALTELVLDPLGMSHTSFERAENSVTAFSGGQAVSDWTIDGMAGAGALRSTTGDLMKFVRVQLGEAENPFAHDLADDREVIGEAGGFDITRVWHVGNTPDGKIFWHNGGTGGFHSFVGFKPASNEAVAIIASGDTDPTASGLTWLGFAGPRRPDGDIDPSILGQYDLNPNFGIGVYEVNGTLVAQASGQMPLGIYEVEPDWYALGAADASLHFLREGDEVVAVELAQNGMLQRAARSSDTAAALSKKAVELGDDALDAYVGEYPINPSVKFTIRRSADGLEAMLTGQPFFPVYAKGDDVFFYKVVDAELHFERDDNGRVNALVLHQGGIQQRAERVD